MKMVRKALGIVILGWDRLTAPNLPKRSAEMQKAFDIRTAHLALYQLERCPFCVKVRRQIRRQGLTIALKDIARDASAAAELIREGKQDQVPCLRINRGASVEWMYESSAINAYLKTTFGDSSHPKVS
jgi:glutaredoxin